MRLSLGHREGMLVLTVIEDLLEVDHYFGLL